MSGKFLRVFLILIFTYSCESNKNFDFFSTHKKNENSKPVVEDIPESNEKKEIVENSTKVEPPFQEKIKENEQVELSDISEIGQTRKNKSEIISFFFDLFETDDENKVIENKSSVNKENNKLDKNKINLNKPERDNFKVADKENNLIEDLVEKKSKELSSNNDSSSGLKKQKTNNDISSETDLSFSEKQIPDSEKFAFYKKEIDPPKAEKVKKNFMK